MMACWVPTLKARPVQPNNRIPLLGDNTSRALWKTDQIFLGSGSPCDLPLYPILLLHFLSIRIPQEFIPPKQLAPQLQCYGPNCLLPIFICQSSNPQYLRIWLYLEIGPSRGPQVKIRLIGWALWLISSKKLRHILKGKAVWRLGRRLPSSS